MKKVLFTSLSALFVLWGFALTNDANKNPSFFTSKAQAATSGNVTLSGTVLPYLNLTFATGQTGDFGNITPGTPKCTSNPSGTVVNVTTNASNGYTLALYDAESGAVSDMTHTDTTTKIADMNSGTIAAPVLWVTGTHLGLGVTMYSGLASKEALWGTGASACDVAGNKYAAVPETATTGHTVTGFRITTDTSSWGWRVDVPNTQKTGIYSGVVTFNAVGVIS